MRRRHSGCSCRAFPAKATNHATATVGRTTLSSATAGGAFRQEPPVDVAEGGGRLQRAAGWRVQLTGTDAAHQLPGPAPHLPPGGDGPHVRRSGGGEAVEHRGEPAGQARKLLRRRRHAGPRQHGRGENVHRLVEQLHPVPARPAPDRRLPLLLRTPAQGRHRVGGEHLQEHRLAVVVLGVIEAVHRARAEQHQLDRHREGAAPGQPGVVDAADPRRSADHRGPPAEQPDGDRGRAGAEPSRPGIALTEQLDRPVGAHAARSTPPLPAYPMPSGQCRPSRASAAVSRLATTIVLRARVRPLNSASRPISGGQVNEPR